MGSMADILDTQGSPVALPTYSMATTPGPMPTAAINGTVMGTSVMLPSAAQSDSVFLRPRPAGPAAPPAVPASAPAAVAAQRSPFVGLASYIEDAPPAPLREDAYSSTGIAVAPWCEPDSGELLLLSPAKDTLADGRPITFVRRTSERIPDDKRQGWIFESALQKPALASISTRIAERAYELQPSDRDRLALVAGMRVATYAPYDISQASLQPGRMAVGGVRRDGSSGPPDVFGFVAEGDLGEIYDADWPPRSVPIPAREMPRASPERAGAPMNGYSPSPSSIEHPGPMNSVPADTAPTNTARGYDDPEMQADEVMHMKQRLRQLLQRREMIIREIDSIPFMENRAADLERELDELRAEIDSLKNHQQEIGARLAPLTERMRKMVVVQRPMEAELQSLRQEAFDNLEALFKLRYLLSRERHRAIDMGFQADAKGLEANRLRVLEKRLQLLGTEQEQNLRANFQGRMKALQDRLATINQQREEMVPVADALIARHAALEDNKTVLQTAIDNAKSKVTNMEAKFIALEREVETKMQETEVFEHEVKKTKAMAEQDFSGLVRWLRPETASIAMPPPPPMVVPEVPPSRVSGAPAYPPVVAPAAAAAAYPTPASLGPSSGPSSGPSGPSPYPYGDAHSAPVVAKITSPVTPLPKMGSAGDITASAASAMSAGSAASGDALARLRVTEADISIDYNRKLGEGGFGVVYEGILKGATRVAVKTIKGEVSPKTMSVFLKEVSVWNGLNQRNILPLLAFCESPPIMISELVPGGNLRDRLEQLGWNPKMGRQFLEDVAAGMAYLHSFNVLHGDLKSLNILIDRGDVAKITDFGLARIREHVSKATNGGGGGLKGTVGFMSPELLDGESLRAPSDVYAFAMVMYEVVSEGKWPFEGMHQMAIMRKVLDKEERPDRPPNVPDYMWNLMQKCWAQEPEFRPTFPDIVKEMQSWPN